jgi:hypothetical protein
MAETAAEKSAREAKEKEEKEEKANAAPASQDTPPRGATPAEPATKEEDMSTREKEATGSPDPETDVLSMVLAQNRAPEPKVETFDRNRFKVGEGHSMLDRYVQGEEIDMEEMVQSLGKGRQEQAYHLRRLLELGAIVRMSDQEPAGGTATGPLQPLMAAPARREEAARDTQMILGGDLRDRVAGMSTEDEMRRQDQRWQQQAPSRQG